MFRSYHTTILPLFYTTTSYHITLLWFDRITLLYILTLYSTIDTNAVEDIQQSLFRTHSHPMSSVRTHSHKRSKHIVRTQSLENLLYNTADKWLYTVQLRRWRPDAHAPDAAPLGRLVVRHLDAGVEIRFELRGPVFAAVTAMLFFAFSY